MHMEEVVDYVMQGPFSDALPSGSYFNPAVGTLRVKTRLEEVYASLL